MPNRRVTVVYADETIVTRIDVPITADIADVKVRCRDSAAKKLGKVHQLQGRFLHEKDEAIRLSTGAYRVRITNEAESLTCDLSYWRVSVF